MKEIIFYSMLLLGLSVSLNDKKSIITDLSYPHTQKLAGTESAGLTKNVSLADLEEGTYYIKCRAGSKYLDVSWSCRNESICKVQLWAIGSTTSNNKWVIKKEGIPLFGEYSIKAVVNGKYLTSYGNDNGDPVNVQAREKILLQTDPNGIATWKFEEIDRNLGLYKIKNKGCSKYMDAVNSCVSDNGCKVQIWGGEGEALSSNWFLIKTN